MLRRQSLRGPEQRGFPKSHLDLLLGFSTEGVKGTLVLQGLSWSILLVRRDAVGRGWGCACSPCWLVGSIFSWLRRCAGRPPPFVTGWVFWLLFAHALNVHFLSACWF